MKSLGRHLLVELYECDREILNDIQQVREAMLEGAKKAHLTIVDSIFHKFSPHGVSGVVVISESHLAIHTWPEFGYAALDFFTCGEEGDPWLAQKYVTEGFKAKQSTCMEMKRGHLPPSQHEMKPFKVEHQGNGHQKVKSEHIPVPKGAAR